VAVVFTGAKLSRSFKLLANRYHSQASFYLIPNPEFNRVRLQHPHENTTECPKDIHEDIYLLQGWFLTNFLPLFGALTHLNYYIYASHNQGLIIFLPLLLKSEDFSSAQAKVRPLATALANNWRGLFQVVIMDTVIYRDTITKLFNVTEFPAYVIQPKAGMFKSRVLQGQRSYNDIQDFVNRSRVS
jgi:hypothetical protein